MPTTLTLPTGKHKLRYAGGLVEIEIAASTTASFKIPTMLGDQPVLDAADAVSRHETSAAQKLVDRARTVRCRSTPSTAQLAR